jgi:hypothetical protein
LGLDRVEQQPATAAGTWRREQARCEMPPSASRVGREQIAHQPPPVAPEREQQRDQGAPVKRDVERDPGVGPAEQRRHQEQVCTARDRKELGQTLNDAQHHCLTDRHGGAR